MDKERRPRSPRCGEAHGSSSRRDRESRREGGDGERRRRRSRRDERNGDRRRRDRSRSRDSRRRSGARASRSPPRSRERPRHGDARPARGRRPAWRRPEMPMPKIDELQRPVSTESATGIAIVVPFRDTVDEDKRSKQLAVFAPHMRAMLSKTGIPFHIFIVEQSHDDRLFNRGALLNAGFHLALQYERGNWPPADLANGIEVTPGEPSTRLPNRAPTEEGPKDATAPSGSAPPAEPTATNGTAATAAAATAETRDGPAPAAAAGAGAASDGGGSADSRPGAFPFSHFILHDVDLLPGDDLADYYATRPSAPLQIAWCWERYRGIQGYFGGVVSLSREDMACMNGYPNNYWGWGGEDDDMRTRLCLCRMHALRPPADAGTLRDLEELDFRGKKQRLKRQGALNPVQYELMAATEKTWKDNGLSNLHYAVRGCATVGDVSECSKVTVHLGSFPTGVAPAQW